VQIRLGSTEGKNMVVGYHKSQGSGIVGYHIRDEKTASLVGTTI
jgi:hypothetical protein